jgi:hypothetical protein
MPASRHFTSLQALHWFLCVLSTKHLPSSLALQTYCLFLRIDLCSKTSVRETSSVRFKNFHVTIMLQQWTEFDAFNRFTILKLIQLTESVFKKPQKVFWPWRTQRNRRRQRCRSASPKNDPCRPCTGCRAGFDLRSEKTQKKNQKLNVTRLKRERGLSIQHRMPASHHQGLNSWLYQIGYRKKSVRDTKPRFFGQVVHQITLKVRGSLSYCIRGQGRGKV